jgi:hypothetical protein
VPCLEFANRLGSRARIWLDDLPKDALIPRGTTCKSYVFEGGHAKVLWKRVAIEVFQPLGASFHYGLLGGDYQLTESNRLELIVPLDTPFAEPNYADALTRSLDKVLVGGLPEYERSICLGVEQVSVSARPRGTLNLVCMAHGEIGSAQIVFSSLARALIRAMCRPDRPSSLEEAMALLE